MKQRQIINYGLLLILIAVIGFGCGFGSYGKANVDYFDIQIPSGLNGQNKSGIIKILGIPNSTVKTDEAEYWRYKNKAGFFIFLYGKNTKNLPTIRIKN